MNEKIFFSRGICHAACKKATSVMPDQPGKGLAKEETVI
jgi:hypothetical protein